ncbi:NUDIX hydrolase [Brachybacterium squillarum]|uniref:NUDIX hydrolase n=1 Tax=Brachybacterium squillarum TaxID=661979 RepID=UPI0002629577|nr:CoA pyrophosphatase [Brachybacterium squillarum]
MIAPADGHGPTPSYLCPLAARAADGRDVLLDRGLDRRPDVDGPVRRSAVLVLVAGHELDGAALALEERGHGLRSQPGQFSLPGGGVEPADADLAATAVREAREETGLDPAAVRVLGPFAPIAMPWRSQQVTPVLAWAPRVPELGPTATGEVERVVWAPLVGPGSLTDPAHHARGLYGGREVGPVFDLPGDAFVWGFTAMILEQVLTGLGLPPVAADAPVRGIPAERRR